MLKIGTVLFLVVLLTHTGICSHRELQNEKITLIDFQELEAKRVLLSNNDEETTIYFNRLIENADSTLSCELYSVVKKMGTPPSGDKHDYMSIGPYWWPNPDSPNGLPYIRKDGEINPETRNNFADFVEMQAFFTAVQTLRDAFFFTGNKVYADKALQLIDAWFLSEETKMNPNINYGQSIPGVTDGREFAIIEFENIVEVIKCLELLDRSNLLDSQTKEGMDNWLTYYAYWLQYSENGKAEAVKKNNHGTHYDAQLLSVLTYLGRINEVKEHLSTITMNRVFSQIEPDGSQPLELARTKSFSYSAMNLHGFLYLARLGQKVGVDLWNAESVDGRSIKKGFEYMLPYLTQEKTWDYKQIADAEKRVEKLVADLKLARHSFKCNAFDETLHKIENGKVFIRFN
ncbi:alginate lyase family protein [Mangrovibacterium sp.]|uniref:alginate lyase family protein n=1 Tax=Mangrovibacterium sp. TaxID=1961364 RepID=UPI0035682BFB